MFDFLALAIMRRVVTAGTLHLTDASGKTHRLCGHLAGPEAHITLANRRVLWRLVIQPDLGFGEAYMNGGLRVAENGLEPLVEFLMRNSAHWAQHWSGRTTLAFGNCLAWLRHMNPKGRSRRNVAHHYDLTDELFTSFLDPWRQYSCAYFRDPDDSLEAAQTTKLTRLAAKLNLQDGDRVLDIGCGWGGLAMALAQCRDDVEVTGITLSEQQHAHAETAAKEAGLQHRLHFALRDYRNQTGCFDRIVSVGMLEHVGPRGLPLFFDKVRDSLAPGGVAVIHTIAVHHRAGPVNRWLTRYIFPGGYLPSMAQLVHATEGRGLKILDMEVMRGHYAATLRHWRRRFLAHRRRMAGLYDERFVRMWEFYLLGCEYFFRCQHGMVVQLQLSDDQTAVPQSRSFISDLEDEFRNRLCRDALSGKTSPLPR
ncbi:MAG: class I SAM-dependent methyltransferase [Candidatus Puniceispirillaceae bacterium]